MSSGTLTSPCLYMHLDQMPVLMYQRTRSSYRGDPIFRLIKRVICPIFWVRTRETKGGNGCRSETPRSCGGVGVEMQEKNVWDSRPTRPRQF